MAIIQGKRAFLYKIMPMNLYLKIMYRSYHNKKLNLKHPRTFTEKLFWLKKYNMTQKKEIIQNCYDKYTVREYVKEKIGDKYLTSIYGVFDNVNELNFESLPAEYVMKVTQSCGFNIIHNKDCKLENKEIAKCMNKWIDEQNDLNRINKYAREEGYYFTGKSKIMCEEYLENKSGKVPDDIRFFCFNGEPKFFCIDIDTVNENGEKAHTFFYRNVYDMKRNLLNVELGRPMNKNFQLYDIENFDEMIDVARKLSSEFPFVRVDLYNSDGRIIFGELTWMPQGGNIPIKPEKYDYLFGSYLKLPEIDY